VRGTRNDGTLLASDPPKPLSVHFYLKWFPSSLTFDTFVIVFTGPVSPALPPSKKVKSFDQRTLLSLRLIELNCFIQGRQWEPEHLIGPYRRHRMRMPMSGR
jgi:hypothetical protein